MLRAEKKLYSITLYDANPHYLFFFGFEQHEVVAQGHAGEQVN